MITGGNTMRIVQGYVMTHLDELAKALRQTEEVEQTILSALKAAHFEFAMQCAQHDADTDTCENSDRQPPPRCRAKSCPHIKAK